MSNPLKSDERDGKPSASAMTRIVHCPASFKLNAAEMPENSGAAEEGTMLHRIMELTFTPERTTEEQVELDKLNGALTPDQEQAILIAENELEKTNAFADGWQRYTEQRLWSHSNLYSGQSDMLAISPDGFSAVIIDYKFGRGEVEPAERNYQLAALAVLAADNYGVENVCAMIIQPRASDKSKRITACEYDKDDITSARDAIESAVASALYAPAPLQTTGYWCNYCPSSYRCKAAQMELAKQYELATSSAGFAIGKHNAVEMFRKATVVQKFCADVLSAIKAWVSANPDHGTELVLQKGASRPKLGNAGDVYNAVESVGITPEEFVGACDVSLTKLVALYHGKRKAVDNKQTQKASAIELKQRLNDNGLLSYTQNAPTLKLGENSEN